MKRLFSIFTVLLILLTSCEKKDNSSLTGNVTFTIDGSGYFKDTQNTIPDADKLVISIKKENGISECELKTIELFKFNNDYISEPLAFQPGNYKVTSFFVINKFDSVIYLTPCEGSYLAYLVKYPLPVNFTVSNDETTKVSIEVISSYAGKPEDFGYATFSFNIVNTLTFCIAAFEYVDDSANLELIGTTINISSDGQHIYSGSLDVVTNHIVLPEKDEYSIKVTRPGFREFNTTLTLDSLLLYDCAKGEPPFELILEKSDILSNVVAYYPFNGDADDKSGNGYNGNSHGVSFTTDIVGFEESALFLDGNSYINMGDVLDNIYSGEDKKFSFSFWIKPSQIDNQNTIIAKSADSYCDADERQFSLGLYNGKLKFTYRNGLYASSGYRRITGQTEFSGYNWYHIVMCYDGSIDSNNGLDRVKFYVNKEPEFTILDGSEGTLSYIHDGPAQLSIGVTVRSDGDVCGDINTFKGIIDEVVIFDKVLDNDEVTYLYSKQ